MKLGLSFLPALLLLTACLQVEPQADFDKTQRLIEQSTGQAEAFDPYAPLITDEELEALLADGLSLEEALHLALTNNRDLQAAFQDIGIAHADWVQSRLLSNPSLDVLLRYPTGGGESTLEAILGFELLELWRLPVRGQVAQQKLEATVLRIARRAGEQLADARGAYYSAVAAEELEQVAKAGHALASRSFEAVKNLHEAGAADAFDESLARGPLLAAQLGLQTARIDASNAKRELAKQLSLARAVEGLVLTDPLPLEASPESDAEALVELALGSRLDLRAIDSAIESLRARVRLEQRQAWGDVNVGPSVDLPAGSSGTFVGPAASLTLPIFDQNQARVARASFKLEQLVKLQQAAHITVAQDVRASADRVNTASANLAFYCNQLLPQAERSLTLVQESYAAGQSTLLALIEVQRQLLEARRAHVTLRLEAAASVSELERVVGAPLPKS